MGIVVIGAVFVDIKGYPLSTYIPGGRNAGRVEQVHGGVCRNVAEDIANVELRPTFVSLVDDTGSGQDVIDKLARHKVNTRYIQRMPDGMGTWLAVFNNDGDVCAAISKRPDTTPLTALLKEKGDEIFADCDGIAIEFDLEKETVKQILHYAKKYRKKVYAAVSNMSIAMERRSLLQEIDCFVCNQQEAGLMFSDDYDHLTPDEMRATLAANVRSANIPCMVVTMGEQGAVYARTDGESGMDRPAARLARALQAHHPGGAAGRAVRGSSPHDRDRRAPDGLRCIWDTPAESRCRRTAAVRVVPADAGGAHRPPCSGKVRLIIYSPEVVGLTVRPTTSLFYRKARNQCNIKTAYL